MHKMTKQPDARKEKKEKFFISVVMRDWQYSYLVKLEEGESF